MQPVFADRREGGQVLAEELMGYRGRSDVVVLGLPRGGVPVAYEVSEALEVPLDIFLVRKLGLPDYKELAMGAIASGGVVVLNDDVIREHRVDAATIRQVEARERIELERRSRVYRTDRPPISVAGEVVILVDDGLATGSSMHAAIRGLQQHAPARIVVAVPTAPASTCRELRREADEVICVMTPDRFVAVGQAYEDFTQTSDEEVCALLALAG